MWRPMTIIFLLTLQLGCAGFRTQVSNLADKEFQARETAKHVLSRAFAAEVYKGCRVNFSQLEEPTVAYLSRSNLYKACGVNETTPINGCYQRLTKTIFIKDGFSWGGQHQNILRAQFKTLVHEYLHYYVLESKMSQSCMSELISHYGTWAGTDSIVFYRFSL